MPEETIEQTQLETTATSEQTTETQETQEFNLSKHIDSSGKFLPGWKEALLTEEYRNDKIYDCFDDIQGMLKTTGSQSKMVGKKGVIPITENSTEGEIEEYRRSMGIPHVATDYQFTKPEGVEEIVDMSPEAMKPVLEELHKANFTEAHVGVALNLFAGKMKEFHEAAIAQEQKETDEAETVIRQDSGTDYDSRLHLANRMILENTQNWSDEKKAKLAEGLNDNKLKPYVMDFLSNIAGNFMEHKAILTTEDTAGHDLEQEKRELMATDAYTNRNNPDHKTINAKVKAIFEKIAAPQQRIIDGQNR